MTSSNFFDSIFDDPDEDPLLDDETTTSDEVASSADHESPSWTDETIDQTNDTDPSRKTLILDPRSGFGESLNTLNQSIKQGWDLAHLSLCSSDEEAEHTRGQASHQFVAVLEQEKPRSLFDFED